MMKNGHPLSPNRPLVKHLGIIEGAKFRADALPDWVKDTNDQRRSFGPTRHPLSLATGRYNLTEAAVISDLYARGAGR